MTIEITYIDESKNREIIKNISSFQKEEYGISFKWFNKTCFIPYNNIFSIALTEE